MVLDSSPQTTLDSEWRASHSESYYVMCTTSAPMIICCPSIGSSTKVDLQFFHLSSPLDSKIIRSYPIQAEYNIYISVTPDPYYMVQQPLPAWRKQRNVLSVETRNCSYRVWWGKLHGSPVMVKDGVDSLRNIYIECFGLAQYSNYDRELYTMKSDHFRLIFEILNNFGSNWTKQTISQKAQYYFSMTPYGY